MAFFKLTGTAQARTTVARRGSAGHKAVAVKYPPAQRAAGLSLASAVELDDAHFTRF